MTKRHSSPQGVIDPGLLGSSVDGTFPARAIPGSGKWNVRCVIYDCDGVLFDSLEANRRLYNDLCASLARRPLEEQEVQYVHCHTVYEAIHFICEGDEILEKKAFGILKQVDWKAYIQFLRMESHLLETLTRLKETGHSRAINTNRTTSMKHVMEAFQLWSYFDMVVTALDVTHPKPDPESLHKIMERLTVTREDVVFMGDSEVDQKAAQAAGVKFVAYKNRALQGDAHIDNHLALLDLIL